MNEQLTIKKARSYRFWLGAVMCRFFHDWHVVFPPYKSAKRTCQRCGKVEWRYPEYNKWVG